METTTTDDKQETGGEVQLIAQAPFVIEPITYPVIAEQIAEWRREFLPLTIADVNDKAGYDAVHKAQMVIRDKKVEVEKRRKALKQSALDYGRKVDEAAKRIESELVAIEDYLKGEKRRIDNQKAAIEREKQEAIQRRGHERMEALWQVGAQLPLASCLAMTEEQYADQLRIATEAHERAQEKAAEAERKRKEDEKRIEAERAELERQQAEARAREVELAQQRAELDAQRRAIEEREREQRRALGRQRVAAFLAVGYDGFDFDQAEQLTEIEFQGALADATRRRDERIERERVEREEAERRERERLERERQERERREEAERQRRERLRPAKEKIAAYAEALYAVDLPFEGEPELVDVRQQIIEAVEEAVAKIQKIADAF